MDGESLEEAISDIGPTERLSVARIAYVERFMFLNVPIYRFHLEQNGSGETSRTMRARFTTPPYPEPQVPMNPLTLHHGYPEEAIAGALVYLEPNGDVRPVHPYRQEAA